MKFDDWYDNRPSPIKISSHSPLRDISKMAWDAAMETVLELPCYFVHMGWLPMKSCECPRCKKVREVRSVPEERT